VSRDPSGWERRILSPLLPKVEFEFMGTTLGPGVDTGGFLPRTRDWCEYVAIEQGALLLTLDPVPYRFNTGDNIYYTGDCIQAFANPNKLQPCEYYLVTDGTGHPDSMQNRPVTSKQKVRLR
jgi:hypothetical protein